MLGEDEKKLAGKPINSHCSLLKFEGVIGVLSKNSHCSLVYHFILFLSLRFFMSLSSYTPYNISEH